MRPAGVRHTDEAKRRMSAEKRLPMADRIARDLELLRALGGRTWTWEFAEHMGCSEATASWRLRRLFDRGLADRRHERGQRGWTYEAK
jgi:predicted transcriptional regulator